jgi:hypothetical protein
MSAGPIVPVAASPRALIAGGTVASSAVGPRIPGGTLLVLSGRRALVTPEGAVRDETASLPALLWELHPAVDRAGALRLVGVIGGGLVVLDPADPLGKPRAIVRFDAEDSLVGAMPGSLLVRRGPSALAAIDVETGATVAQPSLPELPLQSIAFRSATEGAAVFAGVGLTVSSDGGRSFRRVAGVSGAVASVAMRGSALVALTGREHPLEAEIDVAHASLEQLHPPDDSAEPPTVRWVRRRRSDPLVEAVTHGALLPGDAALIAAPDLLARVDAASGAVRELVELAGAPPDPGWGCQVDRAGTELWASCNSGVRWTLSRIHAESSLRADPPVAEVEYSHQRLHLVTGRAAVHCGPRPAAGKTSRPGAFASSTAAGDRSASPGAGMPALGRSPTDGWPISARPRRRRPIRAPAAGLRPSRSKQSTPRGPRRRSPP